MPIPYITRSYNGSSRRFCDDVVGDYVLEKETVDKIKHSLLLFVRHR
eukprot:UN03298